MGHCPHTPHMSADDLMTQWLKPSWDKDRKKPQLDTPPQKQHEVRPIGWGLSSQLLQRLRQPKNANKFRLQSEFRASVGMIAGSYLRVKSVNETKASHGEQE